MGFPDGASGKEPAGQRSRPKRLSVQSLDQEDPLEEGIATHSSTPARRIPWTKKPGGLQSIGSQTVVHESDIACTHTTIHHVLGSADTMVYKF